MKKVFILVTMCLVFIVTINRIHLAEEVGSITPNDTQKKIAIPNNEAIPVENNTEEEMSQEEWEEKEQMAAGKALYEMKCKKCHALQKTLSKKRTFNEWKEITEKMHKKDFIWILPADAMTIAEYLFKINGVKEKEIELDTTSQMKKAE